MSSLARVVLNGDGVLLVCRRGRILLAHTALPGLIVTLATACAAMSARREGWLAPSVIVRPTSPVAGRFIGRVSASRLSRARRAETRQSRSWRSLGAIGTLTPYFKPKSRAPTHSATPSKGNTGLELPLFCAATITPAPSSAGIA